MKIHLLIAMTDTDYVDHISGVIVEKYADTFEVSTCSSAQLLQGMVRQQKYDIVLLDCDLSECLEPGKVRMPIVLWDDGSHARPAADMRVLPKYQRISKMMGDVLGEYAEVAKDNGMLGGGKSHITAVWSPAGGCGKTTTALAYAAQQVSEGKKIVYLNLEPFSSTSVYFSCAGKSISSVFEKLDSNVELLLQSVRQEDGGSGILYFCPPENYDDINILNDEDIKALLKGCCVGVDGLVVDLGTECAMHTQCVFDLADKIFLVSDGSAASRAKCGQFRTQHNVYNRNQNKIVLVTNRGAVESAAQGERKIALPLVKSDDPVVVYKTLSAGYFKD